MSGVVGARWELRGGPKNADTGQLWVQDSRYYHGEWQHIGQVRPHPNRGFRYHNLADYPIASGEHAQQGITTAIESWRIIAAREARP